VIQCLLPSAVTSLGSPAKLLSLATGALSAWTSEHKCWDATGAILSRLLVSRVLLFGFRDADFAKRFYAKQVGGEGRTRTFEAMRRLIYSQLPLPLGTLPLSTASQPPAGNGEDKAFDDAETADPITGARSARLWAKHPAQVNQGQAANQASSCSNCHSQEPVTQAGP
jgi:hypothetical protein